MKINFLVGQCVALTLSACTSVGMLESARSTAHIDGVVIRGPFEPYRIEVDLNGKKYRGAWRTHNPTDEQKAATPYPHRKHVGQVHATLTADDGSAIVCSWLTHGNAAGGVCTDDGQEYPLILK